jgi:cell division protein FtsQ
MARNDGYSTNTPSSAGSARGGGWPDYTSVRDEPLRSRGRTAVAGPNDAFDDEDDLNPRLMDLDEEEESPFLRGQKRVPVRRGPLPRRAANRLKMAAVALTCLGILVLAAYGLYGYGAHSWRFHVESSDDLDIAGMQNVSRAQVMEVFAADLGRNVFFVPLNQRKRQLEQLSWVESATVMRLLPHRLSIQVRERVPVAFAQVGSRIQLIDANGVLMETPAKALKKYSFPVLVGMSDSEPLSTRVARMRIFTRVMHDLESEGAHLSQDVSEMDLTDPEDVKVTATDDAGAVLVHLGGSDVLERFKLYKAHVQEWRQKFQKLESVDLRYERQVIVNPDTRPATTSASGQGIAAASSPGKRARASKPAAATVAGRKPAATIR